MYLILGLKGENPTYYRMGNSNPILEVLILTLWEVIFDVLCIQIISYDNWLNCKKYILFVKAIMISAKT